MKLTVLGSGTSVPHPQRAASGFFLEVENKKILLDAGADVAHRMGREGVAWDELDAIWISHFHLDHLGGLAPLLFGIKYAPTTQTRKKPLTIYAPRDFGQVFKQFDDAANYELLKQPFPVETVEVEADAGFDLLGLKAHTLSTPHTKESLALRLVGNGKRLVYTADTGVAAELQDFARDADVLIIEASFVEQSPVKTHLVLDEAITVAEASGARESLLVHLYPEWDTVDANAEIKRRTQTDIAAAHDGLVKSIR